MPYKHPIQYFAIRDVFQMGWVRFKLRKMTAIYYGIIEAQVGATHLRNCVHYMCIS